ncbi:MAG: succinate dehydrogenase, cytochrome b556 subunit [Proteobacteria bacterium]|nr:succinate dehydrogenase, cytochrome b556 subunit [Pseudomonadota bacterium]MBW3617417.1 succinate dehydrogenase, cytochrome b556 subunit [Pseudomonadota bacterium]
MPQVTADLQGASRDASAARTPGSRPLSPHVQVWRWHPTMVASILSRITGVGLYLGAFIAAGWAWALASGREPYERYMELLGSPLGVLVLLGLTLAYFYHFAGGIRHLVFDAGRGLNPKLADMTALAAIVFAVAATAMVFGVAFVTGALDGLI